MEARARWVYVTVWGNEADDWALKQVHRMADNLAICSCEQCGNHWPRYYRKRERRLVRHALSAVRLGVLLPEDAQLTPRLY